MMYFIETVIPVKLFVLIIVHVTHAHVLTVKIISPRGFHVDGKGCTKIQLRCTDEVDGHHICAIIVVATGIKRDLPRITRTQKFRRINRYPLAVVNFSKL